VNIVRFDVTRFWPSGSTTRSHSVALRLPVFRDGKQPDALDVCDRNNVAITWSRIACIRLIGTTAKLATHF